MLSLRESKLVTAEYPATSSILTSWLRGMRYAERIKVKMVRYFYKLATRYAVREKN